jgi:serine phosphatase RsbU (regulator of sigma subunit)
MSPMAPVEKHISFGRSLAGRLLAWLLIMLGLPCLIYLVIIGRGGDELYRDDVVATLHEAVQARGDLFGVPPEQIGIAMRMLADWVPWENVESKEAAGSDPTKLQLRATAQALLSEVTGSVDYLWAGYAKPEGEAYRIVLATDSIHEGDRLDTTVVRQAKGHPSASTIIALPIGAQGLVLALPVSGGIVFSVLNLRSSLEEASAKPSVAFPIDVALLDTTGDVLITSYLPWGSKRFTTRASAPRGSEPIRLRPSLQYPDAWEFDWAGEVWTAAIRPVANGQVRILAAASMDEALAGQYTQNWLSIAIGLAVLMLSSGCAILISLKLISPLAQLDRQLSRVRAGDWEGQLPTHPLGYELNVVTEGMNRTLQTLRRSTQEAASAEAETAALQREWSVARQVQERTLPTQIPLVAGIELAAVYKPAKEVAGDLYDLAVRDAPHSELLMALADVCGKGIGACLHALTLRGALRSAFYSARGLAEMVVYANRLFIQDTATTSMFATLAAVLYQPASRQLHYTCCGNPPLLYMHRDGVVERLQTPGLALGVMEPIAVQVGTLRLEEGELLILYSDGITEAHDQEGRLFGEGRLTEVVRTHRNLTAQQIVDAVVEAVAAFQGSAEQHDDITLVVARGVP